MSYLNVPVKRARKGMDFSLSEINSRKSFCLNLHKRCVVRNKFLLLNKLAFVRYKYISYSESCIVFVFSVKYVLCYI